MNTEQREIIRQNFVRLVGDLECSEDFLSHFVPQRIFTMEMIDNLTRDHGQTRSRRFLNDVQKKGAFAFDVLYNALIDTFQYEVADLLKPSLAPSRQNAMNPVQETGQGAGPSAGGGASGGHRGSGDPEPAGAASSRTGGTSSREPVYEEVDRPPVPADDADSDLSDSLEYLDENNEYLDRISLRMMPCRKARIKKLFNSDSVYRMSGPTRGRCLVINNKYFNKSPKEGQQALDDRDGSDMDVKNISTVFKNLHFNVNVKSDLTSQEMLDELRNETKHPDYSKHSLGVSALVIMTHGTENRLYGKDGTSIKYSDVFDLLSAYRFKAMAGKPKLVILQACSGERKDTMGKYTSDSSGTVVDAQPSPQNTETTPRRHPSVEAPFPGDYLSSDDLYIMKASFLSFVSSRHSRQGTWFIRAIVVALYKHACHRDIQAIFQQVKKKVRDKSMLANRMYGHTSGQQPTDECNFPNGKKLYFFPEYNP